MWLCFISIFFIIPSFLLLHTIVNNGETIKNLRSKEEDVGNKVQFTALFLLRLVDSVENVVSMHSIQLFNSVYNNTIDNIIES